MRTRPRSRLRKIADIVIPLLVGLYLLALVLEPPSEDPPWTLVGMLVAAGQAAALRWQEHVLDYTPGAAGDAIAIGHLPDTAAGLSPAIAALVVLGRLAVFLGAAWALFERRDAGAAFS